jgi:hypothetical protein
MTDNAYIITGRDKPLGEFHIYWADTLGQAIARKDELEAEFGGDWVVAARLW